MKVAGAVKLDIGDGHISTKDCFRDSVGKPLRTLHRVRNNKTVWRDTGVITACRIVERFRYDSIYFEGETYLPNHLIKSVIKWEFTALIEKAQLIAITMTPIYARSPAIFHNDNPIPGT